MKHLHIKRLALAFCCGGALFLGAPSAKAVTVSFVNQNSNYTNAQAYFMFGGNVTGTINGAAVDGSKSYSFDQQGSGVVLQSFIGGRILFSLGNPLSSAHPNFQTGSGGDAGTRWDKVEMSYVPNGVSVANLSAADFFGIPIRIDTYDSMDSQTPVQTLTWRASTATVFNALGALSNNNAGAVVTGTGGVPANAGSVLRVINPATVPPSVIGAYPNFNAYIQHIQQNNISTSITGQFSGPGGTPATTTQTYSFTATIPSDGANAGALVLTGGGEVVGNNHTIVFPAATLNTAFYQASPQYFTVDGVQDPDNDVYQAAAANVLGGFNMGLVGSTSTNPNTGNPYMNDASGLWYVPPVPEDKVFAYAQPSNPTFYNQFAAYVSSVSDAYGFPYTDLLAKPQISLNSPIVKVVITILADGGSSPNPGNVADAMAYYDLGNSLYQTYYDQGDYALASFYLYTNWGVGAFILYNETDYPTAIDLYYTYTGVGYSEYYTALGQPYIGLYYYYLCQAQVDLALQDTAGYYTNMANGVSSYFVAIGETDAAAYYYYYYMGLATAAGA